MKLKPKSADVLLRYECPHCQAEHWVRPKEVAAIGKLLCSCDNVLQFEPLTIKIVPVYVTAKPKPKTQVARTAPTTEPIGSDKGHIVAGLVGLGYKQKQAETAVAKAIGLVGVGSTDELLLQQAIEVLQ